MKKNISINISGIIFHIEEDGYENLRKYLDSINKYFSSFEDSSEILADIESRIAEIFLSKLNEGKQVITAEDVTSLIATMGSVSDFRAAEDQEFQTAEPQSRTTSGASNASSSSSSSQSSSNTGQNTSAKKYAPPKQMLRDQKRKILGGVCAGLGNYFNVDPVWIRLLFAVLAFAYGITIIVYLVMWIVVPGSFDLDEPEIDKKMFRDTERKVLGGVSGGLAAYLGIDIVAVRVLFVIFTIVGGLGFVAYVVLWIVLPEARTLTDRMQMQGEPVTLSNIESNIKKNLNVDETKEESVFTKIILFPFRLIGMFLTGLSKIVGPIVEVLRVAIGIMIILMGLSLIFSAVVGGGLLMGIFSAATFHWADAPSFPMEEFMSSFPGWLGIAGFLVMLIPGIFIMLLGSSVIGKKIVFGAAVGWTLFVVFFISVALVSVGISKIVYAFKQNGSFKIENTYPVSGKRAILKLNEVGMDDYGAASLVLKGYDGKDLKLVQEFSAQGNTRQKAIEHARMVDYKVDVQDSIFTFDSNVIFKEGALFRAQEVDLTLYVPYDFPFVLTEEMSRSRFLSHYIDGEFLDGFVWRMTPKGLDCLTCPVADGDPENHDGTESESYSLTDFSEIEISGLFSLNITQGNEYSVNLTGANNEKEKYKIVREENTLIITYNEDRKVWRKNLLDMDHEIQIDITMPEVSKLQAKGAGKIRMNNFNADHLDIDLTGAINLEGKFDAKDLTIDLTGASQLDLEGQGETMDATIQGASSLKAYEFKVKDASVEVNGASSAQVNVTGTLDMEEGITSSIEYKGRPDVTKHH
jgi:phage shock protein PspC (stress-responsive transcriptional regulator)